MGADVIKISKYDDLLNIINDMSAKYQLTNDINITATDWKAIGDADNPFTGYFNGNGYTITIESFDLSSFWNKQSADVGLFSVISDQFFWQGRYKRADARAGQYRRQQNE